MANSKSLLIPIEISLTPLKFLFNSIAICFVLANETSVNFESVVFLGITIIPFKFKLGREIIFLAKL